MLRNKQHSMIPRASWLVAEDDRRGDDDRVEALAEMIDCLDLDSFLHDHGYRRRLNDALAWFSDEEFDRFERLYTRRFTIN